jgi:hypothetical protein
MAGFPENVMDEIAVSMAQYMPDSIVVEADPLAVPPVVEVTEPVPIVRRPLRYVDPARTIGLHAVDWTPEAGSAVMGQEEPQLARYLIRIQNLIKAGDEDEGRSLYVIDAKMIRAILYRDTALRVRCGELSEELLDTLERFKKFGVRNQRFLNNELSGQFVFLATTELWVETEVTQL